VDKTESNRNNARLSTGPRDTTNTRFNAVKHGLLAKGITELDDPEEYESLVQRLIAAKSPVGDLEMFFLKRIAFQMVRLQRAGRLEAEYITGELHPPELGQTLAESCSDTEVIEPGYLAAIGAVSALNLATGFQRYETAIENKLYRAINELEKLQRIRRGEYVPPPQALDVSINSERPI
jgi:hypothetical protein